MNDQPTAQNSFPYHSPEEIPLNWRSSSAETLYSQMYDLCYEWTLKITKNVQQLPNYSDLRNSIHPECFDLLIEKTLYLELIPYATKYIRLDAFLKYGHTNIKTEIEVSDPYYFSILSNMISHPQIQWKCSPFYRRILSEAKTLLILFLKTCTRFYSFPKHDLSQEPRIGMEMIEGLSSMEIRSELSWWDESISPSRLVCLLALPIPEEQIEQFQQLRQEGCTFLREFRTNNAFFRKIPKIQRPRPLIKKIFFPPFSLERWLSVHTHSWKWMIQYWQDFFSAYHIKIWISLHEMDINSIIQRIAIENIKGITMSRQRSECFQRNKLAYRPSHLHLTWGSSGMHYQVKTHNRNEFLLPIGHIFGPHKNKNYPTAQKFQQQLKNAGVTFIIAIMDSASGLDYEMTSQELQNFYSDLFAWACTTNAVGFIIKKKGTQTIFPISNPYLEQLITQKRIFFSIKPKRLLPIVASQVANLTIGINTFSAGLEASIAGYRSIYYYPAYSNGHLLGDEFPNTVVFTSLDSLLEAVKTVYQEEDTNIGILPELLKEIDYYGDGKASKRMKKILLFLLQSDLSNRDLIYPQLCEHLDISYSEVNSIIKQAQKLNPL